MAKDRRSELHTEFGKEALEDTSSGFTIPNDKLVEFVKEGIRASFPEAEWFRNETRAIGGREFLVFELEGTVRGQARHVFQAMTLAGREVVAVSFGFDPAEAETWGPRGLEILDSIELAD